VNLLVLKEIDFLDYRVAVTPEIGKRFTELGHLVLIETEAGIRSGFSNHDYVSAGCEIMFNRCFTDIDIVFSVNPLPADCIRSLAPSTVVISPQDLFSRVENLTLLTEMRVTSYALDLIPRTTRAQYMDILSSQANLAGYKAVIEAAHLLNRALPLMMTTAGTIPAAKVLVIGAGVAGLQAIATAKRLGAIVSAFDVRAAAKEQVESLGAKFIDIENAERTDGVYAKRMTSYYKKMQEKKLLSVLSHQDIIITTAQIPGKKAPVILEAEMIKVMKTDSIIIDLASKSGGNCAFTKHGKTVEMDGVTIVSFDNILNLIPHDASRLFAKNIFAFFEFLTQKMEENPDISTIEDEIIKATLLTYNGRLMNAQMGRLQRNQC
jgi:NAD(P) transhydrogenase subunit alpha